ncbi:MAG: hypothetical protein ACJ786_11560 [Catenulispora sp.]
MTADVAFLRPIVKRLGRDRVHRLVDMAADEMEPATADHSNVIDLRGGPAPAEHEAAPPAAHR